MAEPAPAEPLDPDGFAELRSRADEGPVVMLNLLEFRPDGGAERYGEYGEAVAPLLAGIGGRLLWAGRGSNPLSAPAAGTSPSWSSTRLARPSSR